MYEVAKERDDGSGICYPPTLPNDRGNTAQICGIGFICVLLSVVGGTVYCKEGMIETAVYVGIKKRIETFINYHHLSDSAFPVKKLFILIPKSLYTPTDLREVSTDWPDTTNYWMEAAVSLEPQELDRAGVKQRVYKNSVYKIRNRDSPGEEPVYVVAEGATPLKTCYDVIKFDPRMSCVFKDQQHEIVSSFYKTLRDIIRGNDDCRDVCEIIYYVDVDENEKKVNVARIILERIKELTQRNSVQ